MNVHSLPDITESICKALLETIWAHDPATARHCQRVGRMSGEFLTFLNRSAEEIRLGSLGGMIHDLGKVGVPIELLHKSSPLTKTERKRVEGHALWGKQIVRSLRSVKALVPVLEVIEFHHEQWMGSGYPAHLTLETIPYLARVVSIVDAFDAMTSKRSYGTPKTASAALLEIQNFAGTQFDPELAREFISWMRSKRSTEPKRIAA